MIDIICYAIAPAANYIYAQDICLYLGAAGLLDGAWIPLILLLIMISKNWVLISSFWQYKIRRSEVTWYRNTLL